MDEMVPICHHAQFNAMLPPKPELGVRALSQPATLRI